MKVKKSSKKLTGSGCIRVAECMSEGACQQVTEAYLN